MSTPTFQKHIFVHAFPAFWSHAKPLITLAILIAESRKDVVVTTFTGALLYPNIMGELAKLPKERYKAIEKQINVLDVVNLDIDPLKHAIEVVPAFEQLYRQTGSITCLTSQKTIRCADFPPPCVAILDLFTIYALRGIRAFATPEQLPIIASITGSAGATMMLWGPERYGGRGNFLPRMEEEMKQGKTEIEAFESKAVCGAHDGIMQVPGYPPMYDYERFPQTVPEVTRRTHAMFMGDTLRFLLAADGFITVSSPVFEKVCVEACDEFFSSMKKTHFSIGPMLVIRTSQKGGGEVLSFLDKVKGEFGEKSLIYIGFGTSWFPQDASVVNAIIDQLIETNTPFLLAHPSPITQPADGLLEKIRVYPHGMDVIWAPQEQILSHPATGWFVTHGGWSSVQEALTYNVPLILWPICSDQPLNSALFSVKFQAAFELIEVRTGVEGKKKPCRYGDGPAPKFTAESAKEEFGQVLKDLKGEKGATLRENFAELSTKVEKVWDEDGDARKGLEAFLKKYVN